MNAHKREKSLRIALLVFGLIFVVAAYPLTKIWPGGWLWGMDAMRHNINMMLTIYGIAGIFLLLAAMNPKRYLSFIGFMIWSSLAHGIVMLVMALGDVSAHWQHLLGDVPALIIIGLVLAWLCPQAARFNFNLQPATGEGLADATVYNPPQTK